MIRMALIFFLLVFSSTGFPQTLKSTASGNQQPSLGSTRSLGSSDNFYCEEELQNTRIVGGEATTPEEWPGFLSLIDSQSEHVCGAVLFDRQWALTAAHCVLDEDGFQWPWIAYVTVDVNDPEPIEVQEIIPHREYLAAAEWRKSVSGDDLAWLQLGHDIALLKLSEKNYQTTPVGLAGALEKNQPKVGSCATAVGWGFLNELDSSASEREVKKATPKSLQFVQLPIQDPDRCGLLGTGHGGDLSDIICAGYDQGGRDTCQGDSGGPLYAELVGGPELSLIGLTSWGIGCANEDLPGIYTNIARYLPWIDETIEAVNEADRAMEEGMELYELGNLAGAKDAFRRAYDLRKITSGTENWWTSITNYWLGLTYFDLELYGAAARHLVETYRFEAKVFEADDPDFAETMRFLGRSYYELGLYEEAAELFTQVLASDEVHRPEMVENTTLWLEAAQ